jgi:quercetin dioxygenase-like cupin family protein
MTIIKTKINFEDARGQIRDILTHSDFDACTFITFSPGAVRGNHYHAKTVQYDYILKGKLECYTKDSLEGEKRMEITELGDTTTHLPNVQHAYKALEYSEMLSFTKGPRQGDEYESDTFRLEGDDRLVV